MTDDATSRGATDGPTLVVGSSDAALERLVRRGDGPLVAVACGGRCEQLLRRATALEVPADVTLFEVGTQMRSATPESAADRGRKDPLVRGVPREALDRIGSVVDDALDDALAHDVGSSSGPGSRGRSGSLYVDGEGLISTVGVGGTFTVFEQLRRRHRPGGTTVWGCFPATARDTTVAGIAPLFDAVVGIDAEGDCGPLDRPEGDRALSAEARLGLLEPARRRSLVRVLDERDGRVDIDRLARAVADSRDGSADDLRLLFYQTDLPKLDANGVVDFDRDDRSAALEPAAMQLWPVLDVVDHGLPFE